MERASGPQGASERGSERERERGSERARGDELWGGIVRGEGAARNSKQSLKHQRQNRFLTSVRLSLLVLARLQQGEEKKYLFLESPNHKSLSDIN